MDSTNWICPIFEACSKHHTDIIGNWIEEIRDTTVSRSIEYLGMAISGPNEKKQYSLELAITSRDVNGNERVGTQEYWFESELPIATDRVLLNFFTAVVKKTRKVDEDPARAIFGYLSSVFSLDLLFPHQAGLKSIIEKEVKYMTAAYVNLLLDSTYTVKQFDHLVKTSRVTITTAIRDQNTPPAT